MSRKKRSTKQEKPAATIDDPVETLAKQIHDESEQAQLKIYNRKKGDNNYRVMEWSEMKEGFYKEHVRTIARERLNAKVHR